MNARPQITIAEPRIRMPAWRRLSPKKRNARPSKMSRTTRPENLAISPNDAIQSLGTLGIAHHLITEISGWVASSVWVKT